MAAPQPSIAILGVEEGVSQEGPITSLEVLAPEVNFVDICTAQIESDFPYLSWDKLVSTEVSMYRIPNM